MPVFTTDGELPDGMLRRVDTGVLEIPQLSTTGTQHHYWAEGEDARKGLWTGLPVKILFFGEVISGGTSTRTYTLGSATNLISAEGVVYTSEADQFTGSDVYRDVNYYFHIKVTSNVITVKLGSWPSVSGGHVIFN